MTTHPKEKLRVALQDKVNKYVQDFYRTGLSAAYFDYAKVITTQQVQVSSTGEEDDGDASKATDAAADADAGEVTEKQEQVVEEDTEKQEDAVEEGIEKEKDAVEEVTEKQEDASVEAGEEEEKEAPPPPPEVVTEMRTVLLDSDEIIILIVANKYNPENYW